MAELDGGVPTQGPLDAGAPDAGSDAGSTAVAVTDAGVDAGRTTADAGVDAGNADDDAGTEAADAGTDSGAGTDEDAGAEPDAGGGVDADAGSDAGTSEDAGSDSGVAIDPPSVSVADSSAVETTGVLAFTVTLSAASSQVVTVSYATANGSAVAGSDYTAASGALTFAVGETAKTVAVAIHLNPPIGDEEENEPDETLTLTLSGATNATIADGTATGTIVNAPALYVYEAPEFPLAMVPENAGPMVFNVVLTAPSSRTITVAYATSDGTATAGADYSATSGTLTFAPGETTKTVSVPILTDAIDEPNEDFWITLSSATNATLGGPSAYAWITPPPPRLSIADSSAGELDGTMTFTVSLSSAIQEPVSVSYTTSNGTATAGGDYTTKSGTLYFGVAETTKTVTVTISEDAESEGDETFTVTLSGAVNATIATASATGTIRNSPHLTIQNSSANEAATAVDFTVTLNPQSTQTVTVNYATSNGTATAGNDFTATNGTLTFAPGETTKTISVPVLDDALDEDDETFTVTLSGAANATRASVSATGTILDDDAEPTLSIAGASVTETAGSISFPVTLSTASGKTISVEYVTADGTATTGSDYSAASGTLTFAPGELSKTISVPVLTDALDEADEAFTLTLSNARNATVAISSATGSIANAPRLSVAGGAAAESAGTLDFTVSLSSAGAHEITVGYSTTNGTATEGVDFTATRGTLTFAPGETNKTVSVPVLEDTTDESDETMTLALSGATNATVAVASGTGTITDNDPEPTLSIANASAKEYEGAVVFHVSLSGATEKTAQVAFSTTDGTAQAGADYTATSVVLSFAPGETEKTVSVSIVVDDIPEGDETFAVTLTDPVNATIATATAQGTIRYHRFVSVAAGYGQTCGIAEDSTLWCWGDNFHGQRGSGPTTPKGTPSQVSAAAWAEVTSGWAHSCGVRSDGTLWCWGYNVFGQLGDGTMRDKSAPSQVAGTTWAKVSAGIWHACATRTDNTLWCWGHNSSGQLGIGTTYSQSAPVQVPGNAWADVSAGYKHTCATQTDNTLWCWGENTAGQIGDGTVSGRRSPTQTQGGATWRQVRAGGFHTCATRLDDTLWCWGRNVEGQLADPTPGAYMGLTPTQVAGTTWASVSAGEYHSCATRNDYTVWCWGKFDDGRLGDATPGNKSTPVQVTGAWSSVSAGRAHSCAVRVDNTLWCWGANANGQIGVGTAGIKVTPAPLDGATWASLAVGSWSACATRSDNTLWCFGLNSTGQVGDGTSLNRQTPTQVAGTTWASVAVGGSHACGTRSGNDSELWCWGRNVSGQIGDGTTTSRLAPVQVAGDDWASVRVGEHHTCGLKTGNSLWCWGDNLYGQVGDGTSGINGAKKVPTQVTGNTWASVSLGFGHSCATRTDNTLWCWGRNNSGQIGDGTTAQYLTPKQVTGTAWASVATGRWHTCATRGDNTLWCWGDNFRGQLGDGTTVDALTPRQVAVAGAWTSVSVGNEHTCATRADNTLFCWGYNSFGQVGDGTLAERVMSPVQVVGTDFASVTAGGNETCATKTNGTRWCWGDNGSGQLGDGTAWVETPTQVR